MKITPFKMLMTCITLGGGLLTIPFMQAGLRLGGSFGKTGVVISFVVDVTMGYFLWLTWTDPESI